MKISKLIDHLKKFEKRNPDADVKLHNKAGESVLFVMGIKGDDDTVWIESESDADMAAELDERFKSIEYIIDEEKLYAFYKELLDTGITPKMVDKYLGFNYAAKMLIFCHEHKLLSIDDLSNDKYHEILNQRNPNGFVYPRRVRRCYNNPYEYEL